MFAYFRGHSGDVRLVANSFILHQQLQLHAIPPLLSLTAHMSQSQAIHCCGVLQPDLLLRPWPKGARALQAVSGAMAKPVIVTFLEWGRAAMTYVSCCVCGCCVVEAHNLLFILKTIYLNLYYLFILTYVSISVCIWVCMCMYVHRGSVNRE